MITIVRKSMLMIKHWEARNLWSLELMINIFMTDLLI